MWVIDLDESDQYKELVVERVFGTWSEFDIYRLTKNGLELVFDIENSWDDLFKVGDRWVFTNFLYASNQFNITEGFYLYEDGEFKYIDKFATGEDITNQNGVFPDGFQKVEFYADGESVMLENEEGLIKGTFNFISYNKETKTYTIKLTKDGERYVYMRDLDHSIEVVPAGTILEDITLGLSW